MSRFIASRNHHRRFGDRPNGYTISGSRANKAGQIGTTAARGLAAALLGRFPALPQNKIEHFGLSDLRAGIRLSKSHD